MRAELYRYTKASPKGEGKTMFPHTSGATGGRP